MPKEYKIWLKAIPWKRKQNHTVTLFSFAKNIMVKNIAHVYSDLKLSYGKAGSFYS